MSIDTDAIIVGRIFIHMSDREYMQLFANGSVEQRWLRYMLNKMSTNKDIPHASVLTSKGKMLCYCGATYSIPDIKGVRILQCCPTCGYGFSEAESLSNYFSRRLVWQDQG